MAWGYGTTVADTEAYEVGLETGVADTGVDNNSFYLDDAVGSTTEFDAAAWYGEDETYGTQADWLTGEGLTDAWGTDPGWGMRSTYSNPVSEYLGEDPVANLFVNAKGMLQRGGKPSGWDIAGLGLSVVPGLGPAALKAAKPVGTAIKRSVQDWGKRKHKLVDFNIDQPMTATSDATWKATGFRDTLQGRILERLGMLPEYKDLIKMQKNADPMIQGWYDDYVLKGKDINVLDDLGLESDLDLFSKMLKSEDDINALVNEIIERGNFPTFDEMMTMSDAGMTEEQIKQVMDDAVKNTSISDFLRNPTGIGSSPPSILSQLSPSTSSFPKNVARLPGAKPIQDMTWREWDNLGGQGFNLSDKQNQLMRAQGITSGILKDGWSKQNHNKI